MLARSAKLLAFKCGLATFMFLVTYLAVEFGYRWYSYQQFASAKYGVTIVSDDIYDRTSVGYFKPNTAFQWRQFDPDHNVLLQCQVHTNNHGFISANDFEFEKPPDEFRIALVGDSLTACITNDFPWADILERELNRDAALKERLGARIVRAMNFGAPGAGFHTFAMIDRDRVSEFAPDLVIVNYIEDDFPREGNVNLLKAPPPPRLPVKSSKALPSLVHVQEAWIQIVGLITSETLEHYGDPLQIPGVSPSSLFIIKDDAVALDKDKVTAIKRELAERHLKGRIWRSWHPHAFYRALGRPFSLSQSDMIAETLSPDVDAQVEHALEALRDIRSRRPHLICLRNPLIQDLDGRPMQLEATQRLAKRMPDLKIVHMEKYLPTEKGQKDIYTWFNLPHDGHFSNYGAELYAQAVHRMLSDHFSGATPPETHPTPVVQKPAEGSMERH